MQAGLTSGPSPRVGIRPPVFARNWAERRTCRVEVAFSWPALALLDAMARTHGFPCTAQEQPLTATLPAPKMKGAAMWAWHREEIAFTEAGGQHRGCGPGFLLVHGLGGARQQWLTVQQELAKHAYSIAIDVPGFGASRMRQRFNVHDATEKIALFVQDHGLEEFILVSHSIGSTVAALLAATPGMRFRKSILVSGTLFRATQVAARPWQMLTTGGLGLAVAAQFLVGMMPVTRPARWLLAASRRVRRMTLWPFVAAPDTLDPQTVARALEGSGSPTVLRILLDARRIDFESMMRGIPHQVDLIWGSRDRLINAVDIAQAMELCRVENSYEISDCGHWPMIEKTAELASLFVKWGTDESRNS